MQRTAEAGGLSRRGYEILRTRDIHPGERLLHRHDYYEIMLIWSGTMHCLVGERSYHLTNGDILLVGSGEPHRQEPGADQGPCERVVLRLEEQWLQRLCAHGFDPGACFAAVREGRSACLRFEDEATWHIGEMMERCLRETDSEDLGSGMMADTAVIQVLILINRLCCRSAQNEQRDRSGSLVTSVIEYINSHFSEELTLDSLANRFFISKYHLSREFGRIVGVPVHRYITQKRLVVAKQLLSEGRPSSAVYQHCGFGDYSNFYRAFRREYGISPKAYVAALREDTARNPHK